VREILDRADRGDPAAMRLCMERMAPTGANRPVAIELPPINTPDDVAAATRVVMKALAAGAISARETINLLTVVERLSRLAERVQQMRERHEVWLTPSAASLREAARAALAEVAKEEGIEGADLYSPVNSATAPEAEPLYSPVNSANGAAGPESSDAAAPAETSGEYLYSPVNSAAEAAARPKSAPASGSILKRRRQALMGSVSPSALLLGGGLPVDPRSFVTDQTVVGIANGNRAARRGEAQRGMKTSRMGRPRTRVRRPIMSPPWRGSRPRENTRSAERGD
jgi:hypothetical protein